MENKLNDNLNLELPLDAFEFTQLDEKIFDKKFETQAVGYFGDALRRFSRNKSSVIAFIILVIIILFAIFAPIFSKYDPRYQDHSVILFPPKAPGLEKLGIMDGTRSYDKVNVDYITTIIDPALEGLNDVDFSRYYFIEYITNFDTLEEVDEKKYEDTFKGDVFYYVDITYDVYARSTAPRWITGVSHAEYLQYKENNQIILDEEGNEIIVIDKSLGDYYERFPEKLKEGEKPEDFYGYKIYYQPSVSTDYHYFGTDIGGRDLWTRLWIGTRTSLLIGLFVATVSITVGVIWGSISGYYGGTVDLVMERFVEILGGIPWIVIMILVKMLLSGKVPNLILVGISLVLTSWIGTGSMVRTQMYRYKNREYVLASRTFGANDARLMVKHILPNALGTIVTSTILAVPSAIFFESSVAYLGLGVDASTLSIGNLLNLGRETGIVQHPYLTIFPAIIISILMISFNLFGNGLRDALNPSLRGAER
ncbi:MAG: ABC transporter permease [Bacilli bacterium]|nr:ABC transporter permease [Bacilli bacterium]